MDGAWERAVAAALKAEEAAKSLNLDGAVKAPGGRLPPHSLFEDNPKLRSVERLSIANVRLASLDGFPRLPALRRLVLSDNRIAGGLQALVDAGLSALQDLDLSNNRIASLDDLAPLAKLRLVSLDLYECPVTKLAGYREKVFGMIGSLKYLDKVDAEGKERLESDDEEEEEEEDDDEGNEDVEAGEGEEGEGGEDEEGEEDEDDEDDDEGEDDEGEGDEAEGEEEEDDEEEEEGVATGNAESKSDGENGSRNGGNDHAQKNGTDASAAHPGKRKRNAGDDV